MTPLTFKGYGVGAPSVTLIAERITSWFPIDYNGNHGTEIQLDTGASYRVAHFPYEVEKMVRAFFSARGE